MGHQQIGRFHRCHQAGIEADEPKRIRHIGIHAFQGTAHLLQGQAVVLIQLVKAHAADTAAAVIPQHQSHIRRRIARRPPGKEIGKGTAVSHAGTRLTVHLFHISVLDHKPIQFVRIPLTGCPFLSASGLHHKTHPVTGGCLQHFLHILRAGAVHSFQIAAAHIYKDCPGAIRPHGHSVLPPTALNGQRTVLSGNKPGTGLPGGRDSRSIPIYGSLGDGFIPAASGAFLLQIQTSPCAQQHAPRKQQRSNTFVVHTNPPLWRGVLFPVQYV